MNNEIGHLESYLKSLHEIEKILNSDDGINKLFPSINEGGLKGYEVEILAEFFEQIKSTFRLVVNNYYSLDEICDITSKFRFPIKFESPNDILISYTIIIRYFIEYRIKEYDGFYQTLFSDHVFFIKKHQSSFYLFDKTISLQLYYLTYDYSEYVFSVLFSNVRREINSLNDIKIEFNDINESVKSKHAECVRIESKVNDYESNINMLYDEKSKVIKNDLDEKQSKLDELKKYLSDLSIDYNFAGLTKAYSNIYISKNKERWASLAVLIFLAILSFSPLSIKVITETNNKISDVNIVHYLGFSALTIISLYFFRVALHNYNSIKAELTQIKLRMNLCMFVDNYSDFSKSKDNREALDKFENIIFSNIQPNENNIPSTFDGLEQLASLIDSLTK
ncbi:hypothetical protein ACPEHY_22985, partial [Providencia sp. NPDC089923]